MANQNASGGPVDAPMPMQVQESPVVAPNVAPGAIAPSSAANNETIPQQEKRSSRQASQDHDEEESTPDDTESLDSNSSRKDTSPRNGRNFSRNVTMQTLVQEGVLEPGTGVLSIDYLGQKYLGDLLPTGKIIWENVQFASPSSWATYIKKKINPLKKSGCGWNSVKYKGKKLDKLKLNWFRKNSATIATGSPAPNVDDETNAHLNPLVLDNKMVRERKSLKYSEISKQTTLDPNTIIEYQLFEESHRKVQPFSVVISSSVLLLIDFHSHLTTSEIVGYLGGRWNPSEQCLHIMQAFPCRSKLCDQDNAVIVEQEINNNLNSRQLVRVGWYHSHPTSQAEPTLHDIDMQFEMQACHLSHPTIAFINSPFDVRDTTRSESVCSTFWVEQPPEGSTEQAYGIPMKIKYTEVPEQVGNADLLNEMRLLVDFYKNQSDVIGFGKLWKGTMTYLDKVKLSMSAKLPKDKSGANLIQYVQDILSNPPPQPATIAT